MTAPVNEPTQGQDGHPAWQEVLDSLPEELQGLVKPKLEAWDQGVQKKLQEVHAKYDPYKTLVEQGVDPKFVEGAMHLAQQIQQNPAAVIEQANTAFNLGYVKTDPNAPKPEEEEEYEYDGTDITQHPAFKQITEQLTQLQQGYTTREQAEAEADAQAEYEAQLEALHTDAQGNRVEFNDLYVTALVSQGVTPEEAVNQYQQMLTAEVGKVATPPVTKDQPPVVLGGAGTVGSGVPDAGVNFATMKDGEVMDLVNNILQQAAQEQP